MKTKRGQTALILILLAAAALIFLAITLNWGRVAQDKTLLTVAADQSAALLASDAASLGEIQKQENLGDENKYSALTGTFVSFLGVLVAGVLAVLSFGVGGVIAASFWGEVLAVAAAVAAVTSLTLQLVVIQPGITEMWSKLQQNQPTQQNFYEQGISTALQGAVTDQVNITDYFDSNANGQFSNNAFNSSNDIIGRFALFYSDRLKMLHQPDIPQVVFFYNQLGEFVNGETCAQNASDNNLYPAIIPLNPACDPAVSGVNCLSAPADPACQKTIPNSFQLNDSCTDSNPNSPSYNPYCDQCCQPANVPDPFYCDPNVTPGCTPNPLHPNPTIALRPSICDQSPSPAQCSTNNPHGALYTLLYDPTYQQNYTNGTSFLEKFGRDQQMGPFSSLTPEPQGNPSNGVFFPNGIYLFFWLMKDYSPEVDNLSYSNLSQSQVHWCVSPAAANGVVNPANYTPPSSTILAGFPGLLQLSLPSYSCVGQDCCVNFLANSVVNGVPSPTNSSGTVSGTTIDMVQSDNASTNPALNQTFGEGGASWIEGDNQFCSATPSTAAWPYNGSSAVAPDGTCEWTNSTSAPSSSTPDPNISSVDALDETMHTLSDFVNFSNNVFLNKNVDTLSATFSSWYSAAAEWIAPACVNPADPTCSDGQDGRLLAAYNNLNNWAGQNGNGVIAKWLNNNYASDSAWCVPSEGTFSSNPNYATEYAAINSGGPWGTLPSVIACLNYNATTTPANNYNTCLTALQTNSGCYANPTLPGGPCDPAKLGRSLAGPAPQFNPSTTTCTTTSYSKVCQQMSTCDCTPAPAVTCPSSCTPTPFHSCDCVPTPEVTCPPCTPECLQYGCVNPVTGSPLTVNTPTCSADTEQDGCMTQTNTVQNISQSCDPSQPSSYANWVQNSKILASDEAPKFTLRALFLNDVYARAQAMQTIFTQGNAALQSFFKPCGASDCSDGGPAAQLMYARKQGSPAAALPNSVIYGWQDKAPVGGSGGCMDVGNNRAGCAHIVKVTAYSPGRAGNASFVASLLPWIKTHNGFFERSFTLMDRDGSVYVSVKRWDQEHSKALTFPNNHPLWQFMFHNPAGNSAAGTGLPSECFNNGVGFGLESQTIAGLKFTNISSQDTQSLGKAFMLNDDGSGKVDTSAVGGTYGACLSTVNQLLASAPESHACARYVASKNASNDTSGDSDRDYSLKFVDCNSIDGGNPPQSSP